MSDDRIQHRRPFRPPEVGFGFDNAGELVPIVQPDHEKPTAPDLDLEPLLDMLIQGAASPEEIGASVLFLAYQMPRVHNRPQSLTELSDWLNMPRSTVKRNLERFLQRLRADYAPKRNAARISE